MLTKCCKNGRYEPEFEILYLFVQLQQSVLSVNEFGGMEPEGVPQVSTFLGA